MNLKRLFNRRRAIVSIVAVACALGIVWWTMYGEAETWRKRLTLQTGQLGSPQLAFSPDGRVLATGRPLGGKHKLKLWDVATGESTGSFEVIADWLHFFADQDTLVLSATKQQITFLNVRNGTVRKKTLPFEYSCDVSRDCKTAAFRQHGENEFSIAICDVDSARQKVVLTDIPFRSQGHRLSRDGRYLVVFFTTGVGAMLWDLNDPQAPPLTLANPSGIRRADFSPDGKIIATGEEGTTRLVRLWDASSGQVIATLGEHNGSIQQLLFSSDGNRLISAARVTSKVTRWANTPFVGRLLARFLPAGEPSLEIKLWDIRTRLSPGPRAEHSAANSTLVLPGLGDSYSLGLSPDGRTLAVGANDGSVTLFELP